MIFLGIDPAATTGIGLVKNNKVLFYDTLHIYTKAPVEKEIEYIQLIYEYLIALKEKYNVKNVIIEDQYGSVNMNTFKKIILIRAWWEAAAILAGYTIEIIYPKTWRKLVFGKINQHVKRKELKAMAIEKVENDFNLTFPKNKGEDISEAILIAYAGIVKSTLASKDE